MADEFSLYHAFISTTDTFGVTELSRELIRTSAHDVCLMKRNALTTYKLLRHAGNLYDETIALIKAVESEENDDWGSYLKYTAAIAPLEDLLLKLDQLVAKERNAWLPVDTKIDGVIETIKLWQKDRTELRDFGFDSTALQALKNETIDCAPLGFRDDFTFLNALSKGIFAADTSSTPNFALVDLALVDSVKQNALKIPEKIDLTGTKPESMEQAIRSAMAVYSVFIVIEAGKEEEDCKAHLTSHGLWNQAEALLSSVIAHLESPSDVADLTTKVDAFMEFLTIFSGVDLPGSYWELKKAVKGVCRPYQAQTLAAVTLVRELAQKYSSLPNAEKTFANLRPLEDAIKAVHQAISDAALAVSAVRPFNPDDAKAQTAYQKFTAAQDKLTDCFTHYGVAPATTTITEAKETDGSYVTAMKERFENRPGTHESSPTVSFELITIKGAEPGNVQPRTYTVDETTPLSAILWKEAASDVVDPRRSRFTSDQNGEKQLDLEMTVGSIPEENGKRTVYLQISWWVLPCAPICDTSSH